MVDPFAKIVWYEIRTHPSSGSWISVTDVALFQLFRINAEDEITLSPQFFDQSALLRSLSYGTEGIYLIGIIAISHFIYVGCGFNGFRLTEPKGHSCIRFRRVNFSV